MRRHHAGGSVHVIAGMADDSCSSGCSRLRTAREAHPHRTLRWEGAMNPHRPLPRGVASPVNRPGLLTHPDAYLPVWQRADCDPACQGATGRSEAPPSRARCRPVLTATYRRRHGQERLDAAVPSMASINETRLLGKRANLSTWPHRSNTAATDRQPVGGPHGCSSLITPARSAAACLAGPTSRPPPPTPARR